MDQAGGTGVPVVLRFADGIEKHLEVGADETLLAATARAGIALAHQCLSGSCGTCVCKLESGVLAMDSGTASSLLPSEHAAGLRLACLSRVMQPSTVSFGYASTAGGPVRVNTFINRIEWHAPSVVELELELADGDWLDFEPGQFVRVQVPGTDAWRSYSMSSTVAELPLVRLVVRCLESGVMSDYLRDRAAKDDVLTLEGPFGSFRWQPNLRQRHLLIAGGTGVAPILSILDTLRARSGRKPKVLLSFGCKDLETLFFTDVLSLRQQWMPELDLRISVENAHVAGCLQGNPVEAVRAEDITDDAVAYLCGPPPMIAAASRHLMALGLPAERIHAEQFNPSDN